MKDIALFSYSVTIAALEGDRDTLAAYLASTPPIECAATAELAVMTLASVVKGMLSPQQLACLVADVRQMAKDHAQFDQIVDHLTEGN